ncbi:hypothetical protein RFI_26751 [Reticulomyxa filosa]|uniref:PH domain-containing protein n=1 Tax=Reticulomyxa filosa TaxID=46433 RepID=X6MC54_RETFI|nr:hypothetical protein RFI_26751 [Reticulomyxa filosa]|eukprot:ETO10630.1 hypothetical protein RFI_26751 [Reticulomyxa filosa]
MIAFNEMIEEKLKVGVDVPFPIPPYIQSITSAHLDCLNTEQLLCIKTAAVICKAKGNRSRQFEEEMLRGTHPVEKMAEKRRLRETLLELKNMGFIIFVDSTHRGIAFAMSSAHSPSMNNSRNPSSNVEDDETTPAMTITTTTTTTATTTATATATTTTTTSTTSTATPPNQKDEMDDTFIKPSSATNHMSFIWHNQVATPGEEEEEEALATQSDRSLVFQKKIMKITSTVSAMVKGATTNNNNNNNNNKKTTMTPLHPYESNSTGIMEHESEEDIDLTVLSAIESKSFNHSVPLPPPPSAPPCSLPLSLSYAGLPTESPEKSTSIADTTESRTRFNSLHRRNFSVGQQDNSDPMPSTLSLLQPPGVHIPYKKGRLYKRGAMSSNTPEKLRYFVFKHHTLYWFKDTVKEHYPVNRIKFTSDMDIKLKREDELHLRVQTSRKNYILRAENQSDMNEWHDLLKKAMKGITFKKKKKFPNGFTNVEDNEEAEDSNSDSDDDFSESHVYEFSYGFLRDVIYEQMLHAQRQQLHTHAAKFIEHLLSKEYDRNLALLKERHQELGSEIESSRKREDKLFVRHSKLKKKENPSLCQL